MKTTQIIFGVLFVLFMSSCIKRGQPIEEQVVYYMENFDEDKYTKYKLSNGDIVYYPNEILKIVDHKELSQFDTNHYKRVKIKNKTYYLPKNRCR